MLAFQAGDEQAFRTLVERNQAKVYAMIVRLVGDHGQVEDLTQEVFVRIFRTAKRYQPMAKFSTWLYRISANVALNAIRTQRKNRTIQLEVGDGQDDSGWRRDVPDENAPAPAQDMETHELAQQIRQAIDQLPEGQRVALLLNKYEHLSYQEIAAALGCSTMAVKSLLSRARCNLRDSLIRHMGPSFFRDLPNP